MKFPGTLQVYEEGCGKQRSVKKKELPYRSLAKSTRAGVLPVPSVVAFSGKVFELFRWQGCLHLGNLQSCQSCQRCTSEALKVSVETAKLRGWKGQGTEEKKHCRQRSNPASHGTSWHKLAQATLAILSRDWPTRTASSWVYRSFFRMRSWDWDAAATSIAWTSWRSIWNCALSSY